MNAAARLESAAEPEVDEREREAAYREFIRVSTVQRLRVFCILVVTLVPFFGILDWITHPSFVIFFLWIRVAVSIVAAGIFGISHLPRAGRSVFALSMLLAFVVAAGIETMIRVLGPDESPYYAGLCLVILTVGVLFPWTAKEMLLVCVGVFVLYWLPVALDLGHIHWQQFLNNNYFLFATAVITTTSNHFSSGLRRREFFALRELESRTETLRATSARLSATLEQVRELDRIKSEFFANISHELRTPLTLILAPVEDMLSRQPSQEQQNTLSVIRRNAERLLRLIDDLLDLARLDAGGLRLNIGPVDLSSLAAGIVEACQPAASARSITLVANAKASTHEIYGDAHRLEMILTNLVGNALKFTNQNGHVTVSTFSDDQGGKVDVSDDGPGIPAEDCERIFSRFYQVEGSARRRHGGAGIGLALARELATLHGGTLSVESEVGKGSTFRLSLPKGQHHFRPDVIERRRVRVEGHAGRRTEDRPSVVPGTTASSATVESNPNPEIRLSDGRRARILVAEDEVDLRHFMRDVLERHFSVTIASNGAEALALVRKERPDLVISDIMMPELSGTDLCREIKQDPVLRTTPVILLTARSGSDATLDGYAAGADDFVVKPFHARVLVARATAHLKIRLLGLQLAAQARLTLAATLAAGVAHEVRNPLNAMVNAAAVLRSGSGKGPASPALLDVIDEAARRIMDIVSALDDHVRPADGEGISPCDVRDGLDATLLLLKHRIGDIEIHRSYRVERFIFASPRKLNQVFLNLLDNAIRAAPKNIWLSASEADSRVEIVCENDGPEVDPETAQRIFDPFFTTRPVGEGTGLGLYISKQIVNDIGGDLRLERRSLGGVRFVIDLPTAVARLAV
jgi:signal transduction histidine kinase